jgi:CMP-N-acetylneuraminic acid synthetase
MKVIALIPARSGSKRLQSKNIKLLHEKPLLWYSIQAGLLAEGVSEAYVSSDDDTIGELAVNYGAKFLKRPEQLSTDLSTTSDVLMHTAETLGLAENDIIITLQPTNPLRPAHLIDEILAFANKSNLDWTSLTTVSPVKAKFGILAEGLYKPYNYTQGQRSQDMEERFFFENGLVYLTRVGTLQKTGNMFGDMVLGYKTASDYSEIDIDTLANFILAESMYTELKHKYQLI